MKVLGFFVTILIIQFSHIVLAYDTPTHSEISRETLNFSDLEQDSSLLNNLGLEITIRDPVFPGEVPRNENDPSPLFPVRLKETSIVRILTGGSVLEDEYLVNLRSLHHFFDPQHLGRGLTNLFGEEIGKPSPQWILDDEENEYTYANAIEYFHAALTLEEEADRKEQFGLLFRSLGHVIHHIQDMAQPQHVRNDSHCHAPVGCSRFGLPKNPSYYETYSNQNRNRLVENLNINPVVFPTAREYWENAQESGMAQFTGFNFVSQGSNFELDQAGFVMAGAKYGRPLPNSLETLELAPIGDVLQEMVDYGQLSPATRNEILGNINCASNISNECNIAFISNDIFGTVNNIIDMNNRASSLSIFDDELKRRNVTVDYGNGQQGRIPALHRFNFEAGYPFLIPRAVAYGAGLINHFFRGRLEVEEATVTANQMEIRVKNVSQANNSLAEGQFEIYYDDTNNKRKAISDVSISNGNLPLDVGATLTLTATFPNDVDTNKENPFMLVFNGSHSDFAIGQDYGIAAINFAAEQELTGFLVYPNYTPSDGLPVPRLVTQIDGVWQAVPFPDGMAGNVDWKGHYVNGIATKVLSWDERGNSRYFPGNDVHHFRSDTIYQNGSYYAFAPCNVLGAAIRIDGNNNEKLVIICEWNRTREIRVFERPNDGKLVFDIYDPVNAPDGWRQIGQFIFEYTVTPSWFFNGDGTEAQSVLRVPSQTASHGFQFDRIKVEISDQGAEFDNLGNDEGIVRRTTCQRECSGCENWQNGYELNVFWGFSSSGQYIYSVDYIGNQEIFGRLTSDMVIDEVIMKSFTAGENGSLDFTSSRIHTGDELIEFGQKSIIFATENGSSLNVEIHNSTIDFEHISSVKDGGIIHLDMRNEYIAYGVNSYFDHIMGAPAGTYVGDYFTNGVIDNGKSIRHTPRVFDEQFGPVPTFRNISLDQSPGSFCGPDTEMTVIRPSYPGPNTPSMVSAATDINGNLAISFYVNNSHGTEVINIVDDIDMALLIPGAPDKPTYDIRLIK